MSNQSTWVFKGMFDQQFTFTPEQNRIALNINFWTVEDRCEELFGWEKCQNKVDVQFSCKQQVMPKEEGRFFSEMAS